MASDNECQFSVAHNYEHLTKIKNGRHYYKIMPKSTVTFDCMMLERFKVHDYFIGILPIILSRDVNIPN